MIVGNAKIKNLDNVRVIDAGDDFVFLQEAIKRRHLLGQIPYEDPTREKPSLPKRQKPKDYTEPDYPYKFVPDLAWPTE